MKKLLISLIIIVILLIIGTSIYFFILATPLSEDNPPQTNPNSTTTCSELNCPSTSLYIGSINSDKYYTCDCHYAQRILPENIICFDSDAEAINNDYTKLDC